MGRRKRKQKEKKKKKYSRGSTGAGLLSWALLLPLWQTKTLFEDDILMDVDVVEVEVEVFDI